MTLIMALIFRWKDLGLRFVPLLKWLCVKRIFPLLSNSLDSVNTKSGDSVIAYSLLVVAPVVCGDFSPALFCIYLHSQ